MGPGAKAPGLLAFKRDLNPADSSEWRRNDSRPAVSLYVTGKLHVGTYSSGASHLHRDTGSTHASM